MRNQLKHGPENLRKKQNHVAPETPPTCLHYKPSKITTLYQIDKLKGVENVLYHRENQARQHA